jgi:hypothetical protein
MVALGLIPLLVLAAKSRSHTHSPAADHFDHGAPQAARA